MLDEAFDEAFFSVLRTAIIFVSQDTILVILLAGYTTLLSISIWNKRVLQEIGK